MIIVPQSVTITNHSHLLPGDMENINNQWNNHAFEQDLALFTDCGGEDSEQSNALDMSNWGDADASQDMGGHNDDNGDTSTEDTLVIDPANEFVCEDKAFIDHLFPDEPAVLQYNSDDGEGDAFSSNTEETAPSPVMADHFSVWGMKGSVVKESSVVKTPVVKTPGVKTPGVVKTHTTKPVREKYVIKCPVKKALVMKKNREAAQASRDLSKANGIRDKEELDSLRIVVEELRAWKKSALATLRGGDNEEAACLLLEEVVDPQRIKIKQLGAVNKIKLAHLYENDKEEAFLLAMKEEIDGF